MISKNHWLTLISFLALFVAWLLMLPSNILDMHWGLAVFHGVGRLGWLGIVYYSVDYLTK
jgi:hypothetical protein